MGRPTFSDDPLDRARAGVTFPGPAAATIVRQSLGECLPLAAGPQHVEDPVQHFAHVHRPSALAVPAWRDHGRYDRPFGIS